MAITLNCFGIQTSYMYTASFYDNSLHANVFWNTLTNVFCVVNVFQKTLTGGRYNKSNYPMQELWR